ncbi:hypothetical protein KHA80_15045 [Anaerobacillus sp. HL2]|nr:hypothetical protein KHA80_15045 [Anaerobacillus sp. HL2]
MIELMNAYIQFCFYTIRDRIGFIDYGTDFRESRRSKYHKFMKEGVSLNLQAIKKEWFSNVKGDVLAES